MGKRVKRSAISTATPASRGKRKKASQESAARRKAAAFMKPVTPTATLAAVVGSNPLPRTEVTSKLWSYIKKNNLQDKTNRKMINADDKLRDFLGGNRKVTKSEFSDRIANQFAATKAPDGVVIKSKLLPKLK